VLAAKRLKMETVPAFRCSDMTPQQVKAYRLAENQIATQSGWNPDMLKLELTESAFMEHTDAAMLLLKQLKDLNVQLVLDDFGTGYSSLSYLHRFPINVLKIDRSFVSRMSDEGSENEIVRTILTLARNLKMDVVAEGVETADQLARLRKMDCGYAQGYLFSKPLPGIEAEKFVNRVFEH
jgi:EAL domain-containing protein (putative c-di-GMP-specific phosphodiesterase class I)